MSKEPSSEECPICWQQYNRSSKREISCPHCGSSACRKCVELEALQGASGNPFLRCSDPGCGKTWNDDFLRANLTKRAYKRFERKREDLELAKEEAEIFPAYQSFARMYVDKKKEYGDMRSVEEEIKKIDRVLAPMLSRRETLVGALSDMKSLLSGKEPSGAQALRPEKRPFGVRICPGGDCRGYLNEDYVCGICCSETCKRCGEIKRDGHRCDPGHIKSSETVSKISKRCPNCGASTERASGCPDMFCVVCKKAWNWNTQQEISGPVINPEYFDWINKNIGNVPAPDEAHCEGLPQYPLIRRNYGDDICNAYGVIGHVLSHERGQWVEKTANINSSYVGYLAGEISRASLIKKRVGAKNMARRNREVLAILDTFISCCTDIFRCLAHKPSRMKGREEKTIEDLRSFRLRTNLALKDVGAKYGLKVPMIGEF